MLCAFVSSLGCLDAIARESGGGRTNSIPLNDPWEFVVGNWNESAETTAGQAKLCWQEVKLAGPFMKWVLALPDLAGARVLIRVKDRNDQLNGRNLWLARMWNHPAVIMWVLSNESPGDNAWEEGPFQEFVSQLDPTHPTMRTGSTGTKENHDVHPCGNVAETDEGNLQPAIPGWFKEPGTTVAARVPAAQGGDQVVFVQLDLQRRVDPSSPNYDPAAERLLLNHFVQGR